MADASDYYSVLGVSPAADRAIIHAAWKALLRRYHPDANPGVDVSARAKAINEAYSVLGRQDARAAYDRSRLTPPPHAPAAHPSPYASRGGRGPMRPRPSSRPSNSFSQPIDSNQWLVGLLLLLLTTAPLGMILVLYYEEAHSVYTVRRAATDQLDPPMPAAPGRSPLGAKPQPGAPTP